MEVRPVNPDPSGGQPGLTSIHRRIHCAATPATDELNGHDELERIDIDNFLSTLAEVAVSVAQRGAMVDP